MSRQKQYPDLMLNVETLGPSPHGVIVQIGAVAFDIDTGEYEDHEQYCMWPSIASNLTAEANRVISGHQLDWWFQQSQETIDAVFNPKETKVALVTALAALKAYTEKYGNLGTQYAIWVQSAHDFSSLMNASTNYNIAMPWYDRNLRDIPTLNSLYTKHTGNNKPIITEFKGARYAHNNWCIHQIRLVSAMWNALTK